MLAMTWPFKVKPVVAGGVWLALAVAVLSSTAANSVLAQTTKQAAEQAVGAGLAAQKARRHDAAVEQFSIAIASGTLPRRRLAYVLYRRAVSNRALKQSAQAISDLNGALFFKGDLAASDRTAAIEERAKAYRDAGIAPTPVASSAGVASSSPWAAEAAPAVPANPRVISSTPPRVIEPVRAVAAPKSYAALPQNTPILGPDTAQQRPTVRQAAATTASTEIPRFETRVAAATPSTPAAPALPPRSYAASRVERGIGLSKPSGSKPQRMSQPPKMVTPVAPWSTATRTAPVPVAPRETAPVASQWAVSRSEAAVRPSRPPAAIAAMPAVEPAKSTGSTVTQIFGSLFGGNQSADKETDMIATGAVVKSPVQTASVVAAPTTLSSSALSRPAAVAKPAVGRGKLEIEVAVLRGKFRAEALAKQLMVQYAGGFWTEKKKSRVVELPADADGVSYAVRYGTYDKQAEVAPMCKQLKADGLECNVVHQN